MALDAKMDGKLDFKVVGTRVNRPDGIEEAPATFRHSTIRNQTQANAFDGQ